MAFITAAELKNWPLPVTDKQWQLIEGAGAYIDTFIETATQNIKDYTEHDFELTEYTERIQGNNRAKLYLNEYPVVEISEIYGTDVYQNIRTVEPSGLIVDGKAGLVEWVDKFRNLWFREYIWTVTYTAGYATIPGPIKHATGLETIKLLQPLFRGGTNFNQVALVEDIDEQIVDLLYKYKRNRIG